jgi:hypothetical protein
MKRAIRTLAVSLSFAAACGGNATVTGGAGGAVVVAHNRFELALQQIEDRLGSVRIEDLLVDHQRRGVAQHEHAVIAKDHAHASGLPRAQMVADGHHRARCRGSPCPGATNLCAPVDGGHRADLFAARGRRSRQESCQRHDNPKTKQSDEPGHA